jgi:hypothetical protein
MGKYIIASLPLQMLLSWQLWWPYGRTFPTLPLVECLGVVPDAVSWVLSTILFFSCLLYAMGRWTARVFLPVVLLVVAVLCILDLNRLQVWIWMWYCLWIVEWLDLSQNKASRFQCWVIAGIYVWSGFNKITPWFSVNFDWFCEVFQWTKPLSGNSVLCYSSGIFEMLIGVFLLWPPTRTAGKWMATVLHLYILLVLSPLGHNWNPVVWPWNVAMIGLIWYYFQDKSAVKWPVYPAYSVLGVLVWGMPILNIWYYWPESMSWKMYANTQREAVIISEKSILTTDNSWPWEATSDGQKRLLVDDWGYRELQVPPFSSRRNFMNVLQYVKDITSDSTLQMEILTVERWDDKAKGTLEVVNANQTESK